MVGFGSVVAAVPDGGRVTGFGGVGRAGLATCLCCLSADSPAPGKGPDIFEAFSLGPLCIAFNEYRSAWLIAALGSARFALPGDDCSGVGMIQS